MQNPFDPGFYRSEELRKMGFAAIGEDVAISKDCTIIGLPNIWIGDHVRIDSKATIIANASTIRICGHNHIGGHGHIVAAAPIKIGLYSGTSQGVRIYTATDDFSGKWMVGPCVPKHLTKHKIAPLTIGKHCVLGSNSVVLPGADFADGAALAALSLATGKLAEWSIYHGNPARFFRTRSRDVLQLEATMGTLTEAA